MQRIELTTEEFEGLLLLMGFAAGAAMVQNDKQLAHTFQRIANAVNRNNPQWQPIEVPDAE